jgi:hypothetical protein
VESLDGQLKRNRFSSHIEAAFHPILTMPDQTMSVTRCLPVMISQALPDMELQLRWQLSFILACFRDLFRVDD